MAESAHAGTEGPVYESSGNPTGRLAMWWFLASEIVIFGGLVFTYLLFLWRYPEWTEEAAHTLANAGALNTAVLLTSSYFVVLAHDAAHNGRFQKAAALLAMTVAGGFVFLGVKAFEYSHEIHAGFVPSRSVFWSFYYTMTGLHALHVIGGMVAMTIVALAVRKGQNPQRVEYVGIYWHFVDVVWIFLFPLLYLAS
ncbi:MAG: cytochrome oxidase subunit III [Deltaproteobacteria bacterium]|nr:cytochrome oxidase subunit III [Deltaproteobacteria bacterium]